MLTVVQMLPDLETGGVEEDTLETAAYLARNGLRSIVISSGGRMVPRLLSQGSEHVAWRVGAKTPLTLRYFFPLRAFIARQKVDVLHLRSRVPAWLGYLVAKTIPASRRPCVVTTFHGTYSVNFFSAIMTKGDKVISISRFISDHIAKNYSVSPGRVELIHGGYDERVFDPAQVPAQEVLQLKKQWGVEGDPGPIIMLAARLTGWKGHQPFIAALSQIKDLAWTALCVGDPAENPDYAAQLEQMVSQNGLEGRVRFVGHCSRMPAAYLASDVAVSSSIEPEAFGRVAVEAQAMGVPVAATAIGGSLETVVPGKTGWLFPYDDVGAFAAALADAVSNPEKRKTMGRQAGEWVKEHFTMERMCRATVGLYENLLAQRGRR